MTPLSIGTHYEDFVREQLAAGHFDSPSELMREALRLLEERQLGMPSMNLPSHRFDGPATRSVFERVRSQLRLQP